MLRSPELGEQLRLIHDSACILGQIFEQIPFGPGQSYGQTSLPHRPFSKSNFNIARSNDLGGMAKAPHTTKDSADSCCELRRAERLGQIIVGTRFETTHPVVVM